MACKLCVSVRASWYMVHVRLHATRIFMNSASFYGCVRIFRKCFTWSPKDEKKSNKKMREKKSKKKRAACIYSVNRVAFSGGMIWFGSVRFVGLDCLMFHWRTSCHLHGAQCLLHIFPAFAPSLFINGRKAARDDINIVWNIWKRGAKCRSNRRV